MVRFDYVVMSSRTDATDLHDYELREVAECVAPVLDAVRRRGDEAFPRPALKLRADEIRRCVAALPSTVSDDLRLAQDRLRRFAEAQRAAICDFETEALPGVRCGVRHVAVASAGVCLPAEPDGLALQAAQAAVIAARVAGVERVVACVPAAGDSRWASGNADRPHALLAGALALAGAEEIYLLGGVRALAALTFGTESIPRVETVVGTGDGAMAEAGRQLAPVNPSRLQPGVLVIADDDADPDLVAADLISAHSCGNRGVLITISPALAARVSGTVLRQLDLLPHGEAAVRTWNECGVIRLCDDAVTACRLADRYGLEYVELMTAEPRWCLNRLHRCRQVILGESAGAAPPIALPGGEGAQFLRAITYREGHARDGGAFGRLSRLAGLEAQARACESRAGRRLPALATG
jgi:sulfopropanediol 3-dehydrogenase